MIQMQERFKSGEGRKVKFPFDFAQGRLCRRKRDKDEASADFGNARMAGLAVCAFQPAANITRRNSRRNSLQRRMPSRIRSRASYPRAHSCLRRFPKDIVPVNP